MNEAYGKDGVKQLKKDYADLKKNPPKIEKEENYFVVKIYSNTTKGYIGVAEYTKQAVARADLKHFMKDHKETLAKIDKLSKDVVKESLDEAEIVRRPTDKEYDRAVKALKYENPRAKMGGVGVDKKTGDIYIGTLVGDEFILYKKTGKLVLTNESLDEEMDDDFNTLSKRIADLGEVGDTIFYNDLNIPDQMLRNSDAFAFGGRNGLGIGFESVNEGIFSKEPKLKKTVNSTSIAKVVFWDVVDYDRKSKKWVVVDGDYFDKKKAEKALVLYKKNLKKESLDEGLRLPPEIAKKLSAMVAGGAKGKIIPFQSRFGNDKSTFGYTDAKGNKHDVIVTNGKLSRKETAAIIQGIRDKFEVKESLDEATKYKKGDKIKFVGDDDDYEGQTGIIYKAFSATKKRSEGYTIKIGKDVVSRDVDEIAKWVFRLGEGFVIVEDEDMLDEAIGVGTIAIGVVAGILLWYALKAGVKVGLYLLVHMLEGAEQKKKDVARVFNDEQIKRIATKLSQDDQLKKMVKSGNTKGIMKIISSKLDPKEQKYLSSMISPLYANIKNQLPAKGETIDKLKISGTNVNIIHMSDDMIRYSYKYKGEDYGKMVRSSTLKDMRELEDFIKADLKKTKAKPVSEGFGADTQKKKETASDKAWKELQKKHSGNKKLLDKASEYYAKNYTPKAAFAKAMTNEDTINVVELFKENKSFHRHEKQVLIDTLKGLLGDKVTMDFGNPEKMTATYKGKVVDVTKAGKQYVATYGNKIVTSSSIDGAVLKHPKITIFEEVIEEKMSGE